MWCFFSILTWTCASRHNGMQIFDISTSKSAPNARCFVHFELETCFLHVFFQWYVAPEGRKLGSLKRQVRSHVATWGMKNCTQLWHEAHFQVKMYKTHQNTPRSDHFWKLRCRKSARRCGAKHILKSKCRRHFSLGPLLEVEMLNKCAPLCVSRLCCLFAHLHLLSSHLSSSLILSLCSSLFWPFPTSAFPFVRIVGSLTSKLPSIMTTPIYL